jgi:hypothetical protein
MTNAVIQNIRDTKLKTKTLNYAAIVMPAKAGIQNHRAPGCRPLPT